MAVSCLEQRLPPLDPEYLPFGPGGLPPWAGVLPEEDVRSRTWAGYAKYQRNAEPGADEAGGLEGLLADVLGSNDNNGTLGIANAPKRVPSSFNSNEESVAASSVAQDLQAPSALMPRVTSKRLPSYLTSSQDPSPSDGLGMHTAMSLCSTDFASPLADGEPGSSVCASPYRSWNERVSQDQPLRTFGGSESFCSDFAKTIIESKEDELPEFVTPGIEEPNWRTFDHGSFGSDIAASTRPGSFSGKEGMLNLMMGSQAGGLEDDFLSMIGNTQNKGAFCSYARPDRDDIVAATLGASSSNMPFSLQGQPQVAPMQQRPALGHLPRRIPTKELNDDSHDMATLAAQAMALTAPPPGMRSDEPRGWIPEVLSSQQTGPAAFSRHMYSNPLEAAQLPQPGGQAQRKGPPGLHPASITAAEPAGFGLEDAEALRQAREAALENMLPARILCGEQPLQQRRQQQNFDQQLQHIQRQQQELEQQRQQIQQMQQQQQRLEQQRQQLQHQQQLMQQQSYARGMEAAARGPAFQHRSQREDGAPGAVAGGRRAAHAAQAAKALQAVQAAQGAHAAQAAQAWSADALRQQAIAQAVANAAANGQYFGTPVPGAVPGFAPQVAPGSGQPRGMAAQAPQVPGQITTLMIKNLHRNISRNALIREVHRLGFEDRYDFLHLPMAFGTGRNQGFAFINFKDAETATEFSNLFINPQPVVPGEKPWKVAPAEVQGYQANVAMASSQKMRRVRKRCNRPLVLAQGGTENAGQAEAEAEVDYDDGDDYYGAMAAFPGDGYFQQGAP